MLLERPLNSLVRVGSMLLLDAANAEGYLRETGRLAADDIVEITELSGGVSNQVLFVHVRNRAGGDFVLKQARAQLRTADPWFSPVARIYREMDVLEVCQELLASQPPITPLPASTPRIVFEDRAQYAFAMTAAPADHHVWKQDLLSGVCDGDVAASTGQLLGRLHAASWHAPAVEERLGDQAFFNELRVDPYYRRVAEVRPELRPALERLIASLAVERHALVHADYSPKNLLVSSDGLLMVDFETGHYGDPAFDLGFFLAHLVLKTWRIAAAPEPMLDIIRRFWEGYQSAIASVDGTAREAAITRGMQHLGGCLFARLDGKSKIDYLPDASVQDAVRAFARPLLDGECSEGRALEERLVAAMERLR